MDSTKPVEKPPSDFPLDIDENTIYNNKVLRIYFEALLLDPETPFEAYQALFGIKSKAVIDQYKAKYFKLESLPRILLLAKLKAMPRSEEREIKLKVFLYGHEFLLTIFSLGKGVNAPALGDRILRSMLGKLSFLANNDDVKPADFKMFKDVVNMISDRQKINTTEGGKEELEIILSDLRKREERTQDAIKELNEVRDMEAKQLADVNRIKEEKDTAKKITDNLKEIKDGNRKP